LDENAVLHNFNKIKIILFVICLALSTVFCYGQGGVSKNAPNDPTEHLLNLDISKKLHFSVSASDGKMSRIDTVSDSGSSWQGSGLNTSTANFTGTPNSGKAGTFRPGFSGQVKLTGSGSGPAQTYDWTAKAKYNLGGKFKIYLDFSQGDDFTGRSKTAMGVGEIADIQVVAVDPPGATVTITSVSTSGAITNGGYRVTAGNTAGTGTITVKAKVNNSWTEYTEKLDVTVLEPTGVRQVKLRDISIPVNQCGAGFEAASYLEPKNVSFHFITVELETDELLRESESMFAADYKKELFQRKTDLTFSENRKNISLVVDKTTQLFYRTDTDLTCLSGLKSLQCDNFTKVRVSYSKRFLKLLEHIHNGIDPKHDFKKPIYLNIEFGDYMAGISPESIDNIEDRKQYEEVLWKNDLCKLERYIQATLIKLEPQIVHKLSDFLINVYSQNPRAEVELLELLEKYNYPEKEKVEVLKALKIPYQSFREWQSQDGHLKMTVKFVALEGQNVILETKDKKRETVTFVILRKEDQKYIKEQPETKKRENESP
jgi:hypothetical protein